MQIPEICKLDADTAMREVKKKAPFYVPEWNTKDEQDFGVILSNVFSGMVDSISSRLNEAPKKHFLSFLEMVNTSLIPASPARAPLTFTLSEGASEPVLLGASTQASADGPDGKAVIFETEKNILATPSKLVSVYSVIGVIKRDDKREKDKIFNHSSAVDGKETIELFAGDSLQKHILYLGDESLFNVQKGQISIEFEVEGTELRKLESEQGFVEWKYSVELTVKENGKEVKKTDWQLLNARLMEKRLILDIGNKSIDKVKLNGIESRWLKCQLKDSKIDELKGLKINSIRASSSPQKNQDNLQNLQSTSHGVIPDCLPSSIPDRLLSNIPNCLFSNDIPIDPNLGNTFYPFGKKPYLYDTFYIGSTDAFSKKENKITLVLGLTPGRWSSINKADSSTNGTDSPINGACNQTNGVGNSINEIDKPQLSWEFWDGETWSFLPVQGNEWEKNLTEKNESNELKEPQPTTYKLTIPRMPEVKPTRVNGKENYWIRIRMVGGNYGKEYEIISSKEIITSEGNKISCAEVVPGRFFPPQITHLNINYEIINNCNNDSNDNNDNNNNNNDADQLKQPEYFFSENNLTFKSCLEELVKNKGFKPFEPLPDIPPAIYFGFDKELKKGPFSLFINVDESVEYPETFLPKVKWQYLVCVGPEVWEELEVLDETAGFTKKGMLQFNIPEKIQASRFYGLDKQYWIRAVNVQFYETATNKTSIVQKENQEQSASIDPECKTDSKFFNTKLSSEPDRKFSPKVRGFYLNSVWAVQSKTISDEILGSGTGEVSQSFKLVNAPVINETIWINEFATLSEKERKTLLIEPNRTKLNKDSKGNITDLWVRWIQVTDFLSSESKDRHYTIDKTDGNIVFGNGIRGMIPPIGSDNIKATYSIGGGKSGNFDASKISKLQSSIAFVDKVFNPISSSGGTESEDIDTLLKRAPTVLKKRDRAIALEDYEWLAKKASDQVARVKALSNFNAERAFDTGWVTVVIVPQSSSSKPVPSNELKRRVTSYLKERCLPAIMLRVIPPSYIKIDVSAELVTTSINAIPVIEKEARSKISEFLHPLTGNNERSGWSFGCSICISDIYSILEQVSGVDYVNKVSINLHDDSGSKGSFMKLDDASSVDKASSVAKLPVYALPYSGEHEITVVWKNTDKEG